MGKKTLCVAILGIDGTGKSTAVKKIAEDMEGKVHVQYMGFKEFETVFAQKYVCDNRQRKSKFMIYFDLFMYYLAAYYEMWIRLLEAKKAGKEIVVFDRYVWEASVNSTSKISHFLACLLFEHLFPKPELVIYLYCSAETSLLRKDDILDEKQFRMMKKRSDEKYLNKNEILSINTEETGIEEVVQMIEKIIEKNKKIG